MSYGPHIYINLSRQLHRSYLFFFLNDPAPPETYPLSLRAALPISLVVVDVLPRDALTGPHPLVAVPQPHLDPVHAGGRELPLRRGGVLPAGLDHQKDLGVRPLQIGRAHV